MEGPIQSPEDLSHRVRRTLQDLAVIRQSLSQTAEQAGGRQTGTNSVLDLELAAELKGVVDTLRELLWAYITALSAKSGRQPREVLEWYKMELAVAMLRKTSSRPPSPSLETEDQVYTFENLVTDALTVTALHTNREPRC